MVTVPGSLGVDLDADGYVDGFEYVGCRSVTIEQFGIVKAFTFAEAAPIVSMGVSIGSIVCSSEQRVVLPSRGAIVDPRDILVHEHRRTAETAC